MPVMRTTLAIADDILRELRALAHKNSVSLTRAANDVLRAGLDRRVGRSARRRRYREEVADLGKPRVDLDRALRLAARLEDEETLRKLEERK